MPKDSEGSLPVCAQAGGIGGSCSQQLPPQTSSPQLFSAKTPQEGVTDVPVGTHAAHHLLEVQWLIRGRGGGVCACAHTYTHTQRAVCAAGFCAVVQPLILAALILLDTWLQATEK